MQGARKRREVNMKRELEYFRIGGSWGGNQSWFFDFMMRIGGCGAVTACDCCIYFARYRGMENLYPANARKVTRRDFIRFDKVMKPYLRPRKGGIDTLELYIDGFSEYLRSVGEERISMQGLSGNCSYREAARAVRKQIESGLPVPCLTLRHSDPQMEDYVWHWFLLTGYDCADSDGRDGESTDASEARNRQAKTTESGSRGEYSTETVFSAMKVKAVTYGEYRWIDFERLWDTGFAKRGGLILFDAPPV